MIDGESRISVIVQTTRDTGLLEGRGDRLPKIRLLPLEAPIQVGDAVITSGLGGSYPKGLPVGVIEAVSSDRDGLHLDAVVRPFVDFNKLEEVLCLSTTDLS
jgi:rod shape-determining protein MreC